MHVNQISGEVSVSHVAVLAALQSAPARRTIGVAALSALLPALAAVQDGLHPTPPCSSSAASCGKPASNGERPTMSILADLVPPEVLQDDDPASPRREAA